MRYLTESHTQPIIDALDDARQPAGWSRSRVFTLWINLVLTTLQRDDDTYLTHVEIIERDTDPQPVLTASARAFGELLYHTTTTNADILGAVYEYFGLTSDAFGQFFTPPTAAIAMAEMQATTLETDDATPAEPLRIADPACGSGRLLLAMGRSLAQERIQPPALFVGQDKDPLCARMTAINFALCGLPGYVTQGDSLTGEATATWQINPDRGFDEGPIRDVDPLAVTGPTATTSSTSSREQSQQRHTPSTARNATEPPADQLTLTRFGDTSDGE
jgi:hypothetical protein